MVEVGLVVRIVAKLGKEEVGCAFLAGAADVLAAKLPG
jgi:hypothetical protein